MKWRGHVLIIILVSIDVELRSAINLDVRDGLKLFVGENVVVAIGSAIFPRHEVPQRGVIALRQALFATGLRRRGVCRRCRKGYL
jgi:hypothetical protein